MISFIARVWNEWTASEPIANCQSPTLPRIGERVSLGNKVHRVIDVTHHGLDDGTYHVEILAEPEDKGPSVYETRGVRFL